MLPRTVYYEVNHVTFDNQSERMEISTRNFSSLLAYEAAN